LRPGGRASERAECRRRLGRSLALPKRLRWARVSHDCAGRGSLTTALGAGLMTPPSTRPAVSPARTEPRPPLVDRAAHIERSMYPILYRSPGGSSRRRTRFRWRALRRASRSDPWSRSHFAEPGTSSSLQALKRFECSSQPKPPVANHQPTGRREFIAFIPAGVFLELIRPGSDRPVRPARNRVFPCCPAHPSGT
jgi:hypothetical protein